jgi:glycosyltransferase involved in cell wall biosynthesis
VTKLLFLGDMAGTGFGTVTLDMGRELIARGVDVRFMSLNETGDDLPEPFRSRTALLSLPSGWLMRETADQVGERIDELKRRLSGMFTGSLFEDGWAPDATLILGDVVSLKLSPVLDLLPRGFPAFHYVPVEGVGLPPAWAEVWRRAQPVAMSEFGADQIAAIGLARPPVVYHGVDTTMFRPVGPGTEIRILGQNPTVLRSKADCRRFLGWPADEFILFRADRHMPRKVYDSLFRSMAPVIAANPRVRLITHCLPLDQGGDLYDEMSKYGPLQGFAECPKHIRHPVFGGVAAHFTNTGLHCRFGGVPRPVLAAMYNAADLYVSPSAEGFGLTIAESLACGVPAVGLAYSSVPEVIGEAGEVVPLGMLLPNVYSHFWGIPDEHKFSDAVTRLINDNAARARMARLAPFHVQRRFSWRRAAEQMQAIFEQTAVEVAA